MTVDWLARCVTPFYIELDGGNQSKKIFFDLGITFEIKIYAVGEEKFVAI